jgi:dsDNA-binding SOS-regulon protein
MPAVSKQEADAWDRVLDAAAELADLIDSSGIDIDDVALEELTIFLARHGPAVRKVLKGLKRTWSTETPSAT